MTEKIRVRIAPSPTGEPHIGTAYTAIINETFARRHGGDFVLRIEDTDQTRSTPESEAKILEALRWLGLQWQEGPDVGGPFGPYRQSERVGLYAGRADQLLAAGGAFRCFCTSQRLEQMREQMRAAGEPTRYDGRCLGLDPAEAERRHAAGEPSVLRLKVPQDGTCEFADEIYGPIAIPWDSVDMQVLVKSDGMPTYHLANVVDDHLMQISHVIRGEEWISSTPKHILLYRHFGWTAPKWAHLPLMRGADRSKLSKRRNPTSLSWFEAQGYLPEALYNFLGLFAVSVEQGQDELMSRDELTSRMDLSSLSKAGAIFDQAKLNWLNARWIRERLSSEDFRDRVLAWGDRNQVFTRSLGLAQERVEKLSELAPLMSFLFAAEPPLTASSFESLKVPRSQVMAILAAMRDAADTLPEWSAAALLDQASETATQLGLKLRHVTPALFMAITGSSRSLPVFEAMELMGRSVCRERLRRALALVAEGETWGQERVSP